MLRDFQEIWYSNQLLLPIDQKFAYVSDIAPSQQKLGWVAKNTEKELLSIDEKCELDNAWKQNI